MVIFHSYVSLPEGNHRTKWMLQLMESIESILDESHGGSIMGLGGLVVFFGTRKSLL
jgi:hypothetical protein